MSSNPLTSFIVGLIRRIDSFVDDMIKRITIVVLRKLLLVSNVFLAENNCRLESEAFKFTHNKLSVTR